MDLLPAAACTATAKTATSKSTKSTTAQAATTAESPAAKASASSSPAQQVGQHHGSKQVYTTAFAPHVVVIVLTVFDQRQNDKQKNKKQNKDNSPDVIALPGNVLGIILSCRQLHDHICGLIQALIISLRFKG